MKTINETVIIVTKDNKKEILLLKKDHLHYEKIYLPLGHEIEFGEDPRENTTKHLAEINAVGTNPEFIGLITELSAETKWFLYLYLVDVSDLELKLPENATWIKTEKLSELELPQADSVFLPIILNDLDGFYEARYEFSEEMKLVKTERAGVKL